MPYDPTSAGHRTWLAFSLKGMLTKAGFKQLDPETFEAEIREAKKHSAYPARRRRWGGGPRVDVIRGGREEVWERATPAPNVSIRVFTTIVGNEVRTKAKDAIRVQLVYKNGLNVRRLTSEKRVNRTGDAHKIVDRTLERMRNAFEEGKTLQKCERCGAPKFKSKKGNFVCADICWDKK